MPEQRLIQARRVVVKLGSNVITEENSLNLEVIDSISRQISCLMDRGIEVILVSSGAMAAGIRKMKFAGRPAGIPERQAVSAIGQSGLMMAYEKSFAAHGRHVAQILLTGEDMNNRERYLNARNTLNTLIEWGVVPIVNENDTIKVEEIKLGDNDNLAAMMTLLMDADFLFIFTDIAGLFDKDPRRFPDARLISVVEEIRPDVEHMASDIPGRLGTGGMLSKIQAARKVTAAGIPTIVARGDDPDILLELFSGRARGTYFVPSDKKLPSRKCWIAYTLSPKGSLVIDDGAVRALKDKGKSLLPIGVVRVEGNFEQGSPVAFKNMAGDRIGIGLVNYRSAEIDLIKGLKTSQVDACLGSRHYDEVIHRDNLVLTGSDG